MSIEGASLSLNGNVGHYSTDPRGDYSATWLLPTSGLRARNRQNRLQKSMEFLKVYTMDNYWKPESDLMGKAFRKTAPIVPIGTIKGKIKQKAITAVNRELLGFMRAIAFDVEQKCGNRKQTQAA